MDISKANKNSVDQLKVAILLPYGLKVNKRQNYEKGQNDPL